MIRHARSAINQRVSIPRQYMPSLYLAEQLLVGYIEGTHNRWDIDFVRNFDSNKGGRYRNFAGAYHLEFKDDFFDGKQRVEMCSAIQPKSEKMFRLLLHVHPAKRKVTYDISEHQLQYTDDQMMSMTICTLQLTGSSVSTSDAAT